MEIGTEAMQFAEKEYINGIFLAVYGKEGGGEAITGFSTTKRVTVCYQPGQAERRYASCF